MKILKSIGILALLISLFSSIGYNYHLNTPDYEQLAEKIIFNTVIINTTAQDPKNAQSAANNGASGSGTGFFVKVTDTHAWVITNHHVIKGWIDFPEYMKVDVYVANRPWTYSAELVGYDLIADLAVIKIEKQDSENGWTALPWASEDSYREGTEIMTVGHGLNLHWSVTRGIITALDRIQMQPLQFMMQHDAVINQGNSGGPVVNLKGEVVAVNDMIISPGSQRTGVGAWNGISLAIVGWQAKRSYDMIMETGTVTYPQFDGFEIQLTTLDDVKNIHRSYAKVANVDPQGEAYKIGLRDDDIIISVDGVEIRGLLGFIHHIMHKNAGDTIVIKVIRNNETIDINYVLELFTTEK